MTIVVKPPKGWSRAACPKYFLLCWVRGRLWLLEDNWVLLHHRNNQYPNVSLLDLSADLMRSLKSFWSRRFGLEYNVFIVKKQLSMDYVAFYEPSNRKCSEESLSLFILSAVTYSFIICCYYRRKGQTNKNLDFFSSAISKRRIVERTMRVYSFT